MIKETPQELFNEAMSYYEAIHTMIRDVTDNYREMLPLESDDHSPAFLTRLQKDFDIILQSILLDTALADGAFDRPEREFLEMITDYGCLLTLIKTASHGELLLTWNDIAGLDVLTRRKLQELIPSLISPLCDEFVRPFAMVEGSLDEPTLFADLLDQIDRICYCLSGVDGRRDACEKKAAQKAAYILLYKRWERYALELG